MLLFLGGLFIHVKLLNYTYFYIHSLHIKGNLIILQGQRKKGMQMDSVKIISQKKTDELNKYPARHPTVSRLSLDLSLSQKGSGKIISQTKTDVLNKYPTRFPTMSHDCH